MIWSPKQEQALTAVSHWFHNADEQICRIFGFAGSGKAQPVCTTIPTPSGERSMGSLAIGDQVFGANGEATVVTGVFPQGRKEVYRVLFRDGSSTLCCASHLWKVADRKKKDRVLSLSQIAAAGTHYPSGDARFKIPMCQPVNFPKADLPVDPYILGVLLGDGYLSGSVTTFSTPDMDADIVSRVQERLPEGYFIKTCRAPVCPRHTIKNPKGLGHKNKITRSIRLLGIAVKSPERFIPSIYLTASIPQRLDLLRGLMDADGSCRKNRTSFSTKSLRLASNITRLVQSLGGTAIWRKSSRESEYDINVKLNICPFYADRKAQEWSPSWKNPPSRYIVGIENVGERNCVCISVSAEDSLYLTNNFIVTHNTTLARHFASQIKGKTAYAAFTGKAAMVMRKSGCEGAQTIHSLIYEAKRNKQTGRIEFKLNKKALDGFDLIVIDEVSMVDGDLGADLVSYGKPILVLGDPAQLPPVKGGGYFTNHEPDVMLTEIHRQAEGNPIIQLATTVRTGGTLELGQYGASRVITRKEIDAEAILAADQVLVGRNATRHQFNTRIRELNGRKHWMPEVGERLVCLKNNKETGIFNGGMFDVESVPPRSAYDKADHVIQLSVRSADFDDAPVIKTSVREEFFTGGGTDIHWKQLVGTDQFDYGYALTVHKAQGSQWPEVVLFDESSVARNEAWRWLYTGITRAAEKITIVK